MALWSRKSETNESKKSFAGSAGDGKRQFSEVGSMPKAEYDRLKRKVIKFEEKNDHWILILPCSGTEGWCELGDISGIIYKDVVCEGLGLSVNFMDDFESYYDQYRHGYVRTRGFDVVRRRVVRAGLYKSEVKKDKCLIIELNKNFSDVELKKLVDDEVSRQISINAISPTKPIDPVLYADLIQISARVRNLCVRHMDKVTQATNGTRLVGMLDEMQLEYTLFSDDYKNMSHEERMVHWNKLRDIIRRIIVEVQILSGQKIWNLERTVSVGESLVNLQKRIERRISHEEKRELEQDADEE